MLIKDKVKMGSKIQHLIVDTSAFINNSFLQEIGNNIITIQEVVDEIRNKRQLRRLVVLPYDLQLKDVFPENIKFIAEFSKKTGDYPSLSAIDIKLMALTYQLEKEKVGTDHLKQEPQVNRIVHFGKCFPDIPNASAGFYFQSKKPNTEQNDSVTDLDKDLQERFGALNVNTEVVDDNFNVENILVSIKSEKSGSVSNDGDNDSEDVESNENDSDSDSDSGWITPGNIEQIRKDMNFEVDEEKPVVACITGDFAMQNVMKQLGLRVITVEGHGIRHLRTFILRCYGCFKTTSIMTKVFCPNCGNKTLKKVAVSLNEDGTQELHINSKKPLTARGKKFTLPAPRGGKHTVNPILCEDQRLPQQHVSQLARTKNNPLDPDYIAGFSPFIMRDVTSKSAMIGLGVKNWMRKNPNEVKRKGNRKRK